MKKIPHFLLFALLAVTTGSEALTVNVTMQDNFFSPQNITINAGDTVLWINQGVLSHTTTSGTGCLFNGIWDSGSLSFGQTFSITFSEPGTVPYVCSFHCLFSGMTGTIAVNPAAPMPLPEGAQAFPAAPATDSPLLSADPSLARPLGLGTVAEEGNTFRIEVGLAQFTGPVDIYFAVFAPSINPDILILTPAITLQPLSAGLVPWMPAVTGPVSVTLLGDTPLSLPQGTYTFFLAAARAGSVDSFYLWQTFFTVP